VSGYKHVHCRYQVLGYIGVEGEIVDVHQRRADAMRHAAACLGPRGYERTEVYDSMARRGEPNLWSVDQDGLHVQMSRLDAVVWAEEVTP